ncbi:hypothetical protein [Paenibacillus sp. MMO-58]|uniref:hypothetical protein n=1 Tax=Paenibacillus sp. MMO-58 TaxID=3081290 RepID=UPI00301688BE
MKEEARGVVVPFVQRQPSDCPIATDGPLADKRCLAEAGGGGNEGQLAFQPLVQPLDQTRAQDSLRSGHGDIKLAC